MHSSRRIAESNRPTTRTTTLDLSAVDRQLRRHISPAYETRLVEGINTRMSENSAINRREGDRVVCAPQIKRTGARRGTDAREADEEWSGAGGGGRADGGRGGKKGTKVHAAGAGRQRRLPPPSPQPSSPSPNLPNLPPLSPLTSKQFTFLHVSLDDLYFLVGYPVAHLLLLLLVKPDIYAHNSTPPCGTLLATRPAR